MCCSKECGEKYLEAVEKARNPKQKILNDSISISKELRKKKVKE